jgi:hypothetical protein
MLRLRNIGISLATAKPLLIFVESIVLIVIHHHDWRASERAAIAPSALAPGGLDRQMGSFEVVEEEAYGQSQPFPAA